jgi:endonuclease/exonuclease/phosphatase family metal-dependent hydrolase
VTLRILSLNLWNTDGPWPERARRIGEWLDRLEPDLIGFQEVVQIEGCDQLGELMEGRGYHLDRVAASPFWRPGREEVKGEVGNAVASRWPLAAREELRLPGTGDFETRSALSVEVAAPWGPVCFTVTHLNWRLDHGFVRERQVQAVCELALRRAPARGFPPVLVGDFNAEPGATEIRYVTGLHALAGRSVCFLDAWARAGDGGPGFTWSNRNPWARLEREPDRRIDYVFVGLPRRDGLGQLLDCRVVCDDEREGVWPSDHFGVYAELRSEAVS